MPRNFDTLVFDAHQMMYRAAYSAGGKKEAAWGLPCVGGVLTNLQEMLYRYTPGWVGLVWDSTISPRRRALYPEYKAHRWKENPNHTANQEGILRATRALVPIVRKLACHVFCIPGKEADDVISRIVLQTPQSVVVSEDQDFYQLLPIGAFVYHPMKSQLVSAHQFHLGDDDEPGIGPHQYLLWKAFVGDSSDNIQGVQGIGPKLATRLLCSRPQVDTPEALRESLRTQGLGKVKGFGKKKVEALQECWGTVERNIELMDLTKEPFSIEQEYAVQKTIQRRAPFDPSVCEDLSELGLARLVAEFDEWSRPFQNLGIGGEDV
jgi:DNA polymerase-1